MCTRGPNPRVLPGQGSGLASRWYLHARKVVQGFFPRDVPNSFQRTCARHNRLIGATQRNCTWAGCPCWQASLGTGVGEGAPLLAFALCISTNLVFSIFPPASIFRFVILETFASVSIVINAQLSSGSFRTRTVTCTTCPNPENRAFSATSDASVRSIFPTCRVLFSKILACTFVTPERSSSSSSISSGSTMPHL